MDITIPQRIGNGPLRDQLYTMIVSGQSEPKAIAELVCDCLDNCDDEPNNYVAGIAYEFIEWATALLGSVCPQFQEGDRVHFTDPGEDVSTGPGTVVKVQHSPVMPDTVISLKMDDEGEVEAFPHELKRLTE